MQGGLRSGRRGRRQGRRPQQSLVVQRSLAVRAGLCARRRSLPGKELGRPQEVLGSHPGGTDIQAEARTPRHSHQQHSHALREPFHLHGRHLLLQQQEVQIPRLAAAQVKSVQGRAGALSVRGHERQCLPRVPQGGPAARAARPLAQEHPGVRGAHLRQDHRRGKPNRVRLLARGVHPQPRQRPRRPLPHGRQGRDPPHDAEDHAPPARHEDQQALRGQDHSFHGVQGHFHHCRRQ